MFTGIIQTLGKLHKVTKENSNINLFIQSNFTSELKVDQSVAHNGICLTVTDIDNDIYKVVAVKETIDKTTISYWKEGDIINLERGLKFGDRLDGHLVQGHVDQIAFCNSIQNQNGSTLFTFSYDPYAGNLTIEKGSICVNGVSLTVVNSQKGQFSVAIIPFTLAHTNLQYLKVGSSVNLEFDVIGKYITALNK